MTTITLTLCAVLDLAEALPHIVSHLGPWDCQNLRNTCKLLRQHAAVVAGISTVQITSFGQQGLQRLTALKNLGLRSPSMVLDLHMVSGLSRLTRLHVAEASYVDLKCLSCLAFLDTLQMKGVRSYASLGSLQQLKSLLLIEMAAVPAVLTALTELELCESSQAGRLDRLTQLESLTVRAGRYGAASWTPQATAALAAAVTGLPALRTLGSSHALVPPLSSLTQLTALMLDGHGMQLPAALQDLRLLTGLVKLGLIRYTGQPDLQSDSVNYLYLAPSHEEHCSEYGIPRLVSCSALKHIMLLVHLAQEAHKCIVYSEQLPGTPSTLWVEQRRGRLLLDVTAAEELRVWRVTDISWNCAEQLQERFC